jgi:hypothetical protein
MKAAVTYFTALYGQKQGTSLQSARFLLFTNKRKSPKVMALPPTFANLLQHVLRAHLQVMLWKAANHHAPPDESIDIINFGWEYKDGIPIPAISHSDLAPSELIDVIKCQCKVQGKMCSNEVCSCHKEHISCTSYCYCSSKEGCCNPYTNRETQHSSETVSTSDADSDDAEETVIDEDDGSSEDFDDDVSDEWE